MKICDTSKATAARMRPVAMTDAKGETRVFRSIKEASEATGIPSSHICRNCRKQLSWAGGYQFRYLETMAKIIKTDGKEINVEPRNGSDFSLSEMQRIVGGFIECVTLDNGQLMVVNEEGVILEMPYNKKASELFGHPIVGNVLVCESNQIK